jgi:hypothetical protein
MKLASHWVSELLWTAMQSAQLLADVEPDPAADPNNLAPAIASWYWDIKNAVSLGLLIPVDRRSPGPGNDLLVPTAVVAWARTRDAPDRSIPEQLRNISPAESDREATPLGKRERDTLLIIIAALAKAANIDTSKPSKAAGEIEELTVEIGARVSARAIEDHLNRIPGAVEDRSS